jgi:hypothetical protein
MIRSLLFTLLFAASASGFAPSCTSPTKTALSASRRDVFAATAGSFTAFLPLIAMADVDDLAMPSAEEQKTAEEVSRRIKLPSSRLRGELMSDVDPQKRTFLSSILPSIAFDRTECMNTTPSTRLFAVLRS